MDKEILFAKFSKTRKKEYSIRTTIFQDSKGNLKAEKKGDKHSKDIIKGFVDSYKRIDGISKKFSVVPVKQVDEYTIEFPFIQGPTLHELAVTAKNKEIFDAVISRYIRLLDSIPTKTTILDKDFEKNFGKINKKKEYLCLKEGILDFNLANLIVDNNDKVHFIDYEWCYTFPIPKDYILFRALFALYLNTSLKSFYTLEEVLERYLEERDHINQYYSWEKHFNGEIVSKNSTHQTYTLPSQQVDISEMHKEITVRREEQNILKKRIEEEIEKNKDLSSIIEKEKKETLALSKEVEEFRTFKKGKIWKVLTIWRKLKKYFKNFFINIKNDGVVTTFKRMPVRIKTTIENRKKIDMENNPYKYWGKNNEIDKEKRKKIQEEINQLKYHPLISIVMPVYNVEVKWIREAVRSIKKQIYTNWELCIADDASTNPKLRRYLKRISKHKKIKVVFREKNGHISEATNSALELATGKFIALMDNDDYIYPHALAEVVKVLNEKPETDFIYSDEDKLEMTGERVDPFFKPDWSPDLFMSTNYLCHFTLARKEIIDSVGGFRKGYEGSQDYDLFLRITEKTQNIEHIPDILYSWRKIPGSTAAVYSDKGYAVKTSIQSLKDALQRRGIKGKVTKGLFLGSFRVKYDIIGKPLISIIIPTKDKRGYIERCISSILSKTTYDNYEIIIVDTGSTEKDTLEYYETIKNNPKIRFVYWKKPFNYSSVNNFGVKHAKGEYILLLNNDTEVISHNWIEGMLEHAQREEIGAVGVKLLYPDDRTQHVGVILGVGGPTKESSVADHAMKLFSNEIAVIPYTKDIIRNYSAVTAACLMVKKEKFERVGGFEEKLRIAFNDVDLCLKLGTEGFFNLYTPYVELYHHESVSVGTPNDGNRDMKEFGKEVEFMKKKWETVIETDPFYNRNLTWRDSSYTPSCDKQT